MARHEADQIGTVRNLVDLAILEALPGPCHVPGSHTHHRVLGDPGLRAGLSVFSLWSARIDAVIGLSPRRWRRENLATARDLAAAVVAEHTQGA